MGKRKEERKLTAAEQRRKERFDELKAKMEADGYTAQDLTISALRANIMAVFVMLPFLVLFIVWYRVINYDAGEHGSVISVLVFWIAVIVLIVVHELIHGLVWGSCAKNGFKAIEFGVIWSVLTPYCTCSEPLKRWQYIIGAIMPTVVLGFVPGIVAVYTGSATLHYISLMLILGGGGDFYIIWKMLRFNSKNETIYCDHPTECGLVAFTRDK